MKKLILFLTLLCLFAVGQNIAEAADGRRTGMGYISWDDKTLRLDLRANPSTGFSWLTVYQSENLATGSRQYQGTDNNEEATTGGPGVDHLRFTVTDDKDAYLVLKLARPWEGGETGTYHSYVIKMENDNIADVVCRERLFHKHFTFVAGAPEKNEATGEKVRFVASVPKDWEYENVAGQDMLGLKVRPRGKEGYGRIGHLRDGVAADPGENVKKIMIYNKEYTMGRFTDGNLVLFNQNRIAWLGGSADWQDEYFMDIVTMLDTAAYWE